MAGSFVRPRRRSDHYIPPFWGDGSDGILDVDDSVTYQAGVDFEKYSGFCIKQYKEINWNPSEPQTLTVDEPCRGLILFSQGNVYIGPNGTVSMAKKGSILPCHPEELIERYHESRQMRRIVNVLKTLEGGPGGNSGTGKSTEGGSSGARGIGGIRRVCQGGFGAGGPAGGNGGKGGDGGSIIRPEGLGYPGNNPGRAGVQGGGGAYATQYTGWRGGGIPFGAGGSGGGSGSSGSNGEHTGGFILIISKGTINITGKLDVTGGSHSEGGAGGGAGGGVIALFAAGSINTASATKILDGGQPGTGYGTGTAGGPGTYYEERLV